MIKEAMLYEKLDKNMVHCYLCSHHCRIAPDKFGFCGVRQNLAGKLNTHVWGEIIASHVDPIEKKPRVPFCAGFGTLFCANRGVHFQGRVLQELGDFPALETGGSRRSRVQDGAAGYRKRGKKEPL